MRKKTTALVIAFLLIFQYVNFAGITKSVEAAVIPGNLITKMTLTDKAIPSTVIASVYDSVYYVNPEIRVELGQYLTLNYEWELPEDHLYSDGDTYTFDLPAEFELYGGNIPITNLVGNPSPGTYKVTGRTVTVTFNDEINDGTPTAGTLSFWNYFTKQSVNNKTEVDIKFNIGDSITIPIAPKAGTLPIEKKGQADKAFNAENITWTVDINKNLKKVTNAVVTDPIPTGLTFTPGTLQVFKMSSDTDGVLSTPVLVNPSDYQATLPAAPQNELKIELGDINSVYRIVFITSLSDSSAADFNNTATLSGSNISNVSDSDKVTNTRGKLLEKSGTYNETTQLIDWEIKYNFGEDSITAAALTDLFTNKHQLVANSIQVYPVADPVAGTIGAALPTTDYSLNYVVSGHSAYTADKSGFTLTFTNPATITGAYKIKYQTRPTNNLYNNAAISNTVYSGGKQSNTVDITANQHFLHKSNSNANYNARTVDWKVEINTDNYSLQDLKFEDTFANGLKLVPGSLVIKQNNVTVTDSVYTLTYKPAGVTATTQGFIVDLPNGTNAYTITYTTEFDYTNTAYFSNTDFSFDNDGKLSWKETVGGSVLNKTGTSTFTPNKQTQDNGYKKGKYNATTKKITWDIGINYNSKIINNAVVTDTLESVQKLVPGTLAVHKLTVNSDGSTTVGALVAPTGNYTAVLPTQANSNELKITFSNPITEPYFITFDTTLEGEVIGNADKTLNNHAFLSGTGYVTKDLNNSVSIPKAGEYVAKEGAQSDDSINWKIFINRGQSTVDNAKIFDVPSKKQTLVKESFKLYLTNVDSSGNVTRGSEILPSDPIHGYTLSFTENTNPAVSSDETFELSFKNQISKPYILEYQSVIDAKDKETLSNTVTFTGDGGITKSLDSPFEVKVALSGGEGTGSTLKGDLKIVKVDEDDTTHKLFGASFELTRNSNGDKKVGTTDSNGLLEFKDLRYGKYTLKETSAPAGYSISGTGIYEVTINSSSGIELDPIGNKKLLGNLEVTKVDNADTSVFLEGATFELFNSSNVSLGQKTTPASGKVTFTGLPYGNYVLKEISAPAGYDIMGSGSENITISSASQTKQVKNNKTILLGNLEVTKVDSKETTVLLEGATFELFDSANVSLGQKTTAANGKVTFTGLPYGNYVLKEISAPAGYSIIGNGETTITIASAAEYKQVENNKIILYGDLEVIKVDNDDTSVLLEGATFELFDSANVSLGQKTTAANGKITFTGLPYGNYVLKEISAPAGYNLVGSGEVTITINSSSIKTITINNSKTVIPVPTATPTVAPTATPTTAPTATPTIAPTATPVATPSVAPTTTPKTDTEKEKTKENTPIEGEIEIPDGSIPTGGVTPQNGTVTISPEGSWVYTPNPGFIGKDTFSIIITDQDDNEEEIFFEIDVEEPPKGGVIATPNVPVLPKTGESSYLLIQLLGFSMIAVGLGALVIKRRKARR